MPTALFARGKSLDDAVASIQERIARNQAAAERKAADQSDLEDQADDAGEGAADGEECQPRQDQSNQQAHVFSFNWSDENLSVDRTRIYLMVGWKSVRPWASVLVTGERTWSAVAVAMFIGGLLSAVLGDHRGSVAAWLNSL